MQNNSNNERPLGSFRPVPRTGVIYVTAEAEKRGFSATDPEWCNLGQGQPETGPLPGAPERIKQIALEADQDYAPVGGLLELREAVAEMYNALFRKGKASQYTAENVAICGGGRVGLMRVAASIAPVHLGHFLPDYTAYAEVLDVFRRFNPIPILLEPANGYAFGADELRHEIQGRGLGALLLSNACNPTGKLVHGQELAQWVDAARELDCTLILDEFYSHYVWAKDAPSIVSAAAHVQDVENDPVVILDGLTKNWRYPGWRVTWVLGPKQVIEGCISAGSFLDGGGSRPMQRAAIDLVNEAHAKQETEAIQKAFRPKRDLLVAGLKKMGIKLALEPQGTFYVWGDLSELPPSLRSGDDFFRAALEEKVIIVPGEFFDVDPGSRRIGRTSRFRHHARFSFGPSMPVIEKALKRLEKIIQKHS
ncbi:MAG: pyridoxal phosphate-dependent aminotransferase [Myxococcales bacterium]|nr:MAG: pyridoxal phosphate-dependent aminotransferase [Myxococcales bacterium]